MKNKQLLFVLATFLLAGNIFAKDVDVATAELVARNYYYQQCHYFETPVPYNDIVFSDYYVQEYEGVPALYVFNVKGGGFVLVSAEDRQYPIQGISLERGMRFDMESRGPHYEYFMNDKMSVIKQIKESKAMQEQEVAEQWKEYTTKDVDMLISSKDNEELEPLLTSLWNQDYPYNYYCPLDIGPGGRAYAGCVATAMSVVMHYWGYPYTGEGSFGYKPTGFPFQMVNFGEAFYNWEAMPNELSISSETDAVSNIALIQYHCGVSVRMQYNGDDPQHPEQSGSGAYSPDVEPALRQYFKYPEAEYVGRASMSSSAWETLLMSQLGAGYPLYYGGHDPQAGGHAFMCDGYRVVNNTKTFHFNFNWSGTYNDWYPSNNPSGFSTNQGIIQNFYPDPAEYPVFQVVNKVLTTKVGRIDDGSGPVENYLSGTSNSWVIKPQSDLDTVSNIILSWEKFDLAAGDYVKVYDGEDNTGELLATYEGNELPPSLTSPGNTLFIEFEGQGSAQGFIFDYKAKRVKGCQSTVNETSIWGTIKSNPEDMYYSPSSFCRWIIKYPGSETGGWLKFNYLQTFDDKDNVTVYDYATEEVKTYYGFETPQDTIRFSPEGVMVTFKSDAFMEEGNGFSIYYADNKFDGMEDHVIENISIYPNPANTHINVNNPSQSASVEYQLYDINGRMVLTGNLDDSESTSIDVTNMNKGVYFIRFIDEKDGIITKKVIIE